MAQDDPGGRSARRCAGAGDDTELSLDVLFPYGFPLLFRRFTDNYVGRLCGKRWMVRKRAAYPSIGWLIT